MGEILLKNFLISINYHKNGMSWVSCADFSEDIFYRRLK